MNTLPITNMIEASFRNVRDVIRERKNRVKDKTKILSRREDRMYFSIKIQFVTDILMQQFISYHVGAHEAQ